jgi:hypothetical protein
MRTIPKAGSATCSPWRFARRDWWSTPASIPSAGPATAPFLVRRSDGGTVESVANEIDRYAVWPGQALGYKVGHTEINRQRDRAKAALGARFDLRAFNDLVVGRGARPLTVVERDVDRMIAGRS